MADRADDLERAAEMAELLAERLLGEINSGMLTFAELRERPELHLIVEVARLLRAAGADFPAGIRHLAQRGAEEP